MVLVAFEGQDGAGKSAMLHAVYTELTRQGIAATVVEEFSDSPYGQRLLDAVAQDKFLRPVPNDPAAARARTLDVVADLYYQDKHIIGPALATGRIVLKDRHLDTVLYTQVPALTTAAATDSEADAFAWLRTLLSQLWYLPTLTVYVEAPLEVRLARIRHRDRHLIEDHAHDISDDDLAVFAARQRVMHQLLASEPARVAVHNGDRPLREGVTEVLALVQARRARRS